MDCNLIFLVVEREKFKMFKLHSLNFLILNLVELDRYRTVVHHLPFDLESNRIPFGSGSIVGGKLQPDFRF